MIPSSVSISKFRSAMLATLIRLVWSPINISLSPVISSGPDSCLIRQVGGQKSDMTQDLCSWVVRTSPDAGEHIKVQ
eukprot:6766169-Prymnesium_polylepis.1